MRDCDMYEMNLKRLLDSCPYITDDNLWNGLYDYCLETDVDLNCVNFDDWVVNGISFIDRTEYEEMTESQKEDMYVLTETDEGYWVF